MARWTCALLAVMLAGSIGAGAQSAGLTRDDKKLLEWFDHLGLAPDLSHAPLVRVSEPVGGLRPVDQSRYQSLGFLIEETATTFTVLHLSGRRVTRTRVVGDAPLTTSFERMDLAAFASETIAWAHLEGKTLLAPALLDFELMNLAVTKARRRPDLVDKILISVAAALAVPIARITVPGPEVFALAMATGLTAYDASYLWLARSRDAELVTLDRALMRLGKRG